jgi:hypothetical protein
LKQPYTFKAGTAKSKYIEIGNQNYPIPYYRLHPRRLIVNHTIRLATIVDWGCLLSRTIFSPIAIYDTFILIKKGMAVSSENKSAVLSIRSILILYE